MTRTIVAGPPCAGKSSYCAENAQSGDLVYDYDLVHGALSLQPSHQHDARIRPFVLAARDAIYTELENEPDQPAWIITSTRKASELRELSKRLGAQVVMLNVSREEAHLRCDEAERPPAWHEYIDRWFEDSDIDPTEFELSKGIKSMEKKTYRGTISLKEDSDQTGEFQAVFATTNVIDHDEDVTVPGAFQDGQEAVIEAWNHNYQNLPVGKGAIHERDNKALVDGAFFLDTQGGLEHYKTVKALGPLQEWSYTFEILERSMGKFGDRDVRFLKKLDVWGVAPVQRGAGIGTGTTAIKGAGGDSSDGSSDDADGDGGQTDANGAPSGPTPQVVLADIDIQLMEV